MSQQIKIAIAAVALLIAFIIVAVVYWPTPKTGHGKPAEIIHPITRERYKTTWEKVLNDPAFDSKQDKSTNGGWMALYPGTDYYGYVVHPGQHHPSEDGPAPSPERAPRRLKPGESPP